MITQTRSSIHSTQTLQLGNGPLVTDVWEPQLDVGTTPILLVHGWGGSGSYWDVTAQFLSRTARVIVPDLPGTGRSQPVKHAHNMWDQVHTLAQLLDALALERVQIVGHSMGGAMSVLLAAEYPQRIERIVLTSLVFFMTEKQKAIYREIMRMFKLSMHFRPEWLVNVPGVSNMMAQQYFHKVPQDPHILRRGLRDYLTLHRGTALACAMNATDERIKAAGHKITQPTLMICARQDNMMPLENVDPTQAIIGDCDVRWIENCGHLPMVEKPQEYQTILSEFLAL